MRDGVLTIFVLSESMKERLVLAAIHPEILHGSDHCPVEVVLNL